MAVLNDIGQRLEDQGVGTLGTNIFLSMMPDTPDVCYMVVEEIEGGLPPGETFGVTGPIYDRPRIRVVNRASTDDYETCRTNADSVRSALSNVVNQQLSGTTYLRIQPKSQPWPIDRDSQGRPRIAQVFTCWVAT